MTDSDSRDGDAAGADAQDSGNPGGAGRRRGGRGRGRKERPSSKVPEAGAFDDAPPAPGAASRDSGPEGAPAAPSRQGGTPGTSGAPDAGSRRSRGDRDGGRGGNRSGRRRRGGRGRTAPVSEGQEGIGPEPEVEPPPLADGAEAPASGSDAEAPAPARSRDGGRRERGGRKSGRRSRKDGGTARSGEEESSGRRSRRRGATSDSGEARPRKSRQDRDGHRGRDSRYDRDAIELTPRVPDPAVKHEKILLVNATDRDEARIALMVDGRLEEVFIEATDEKSQAGNIHRGRVQNVEKGIGAAFVDMGRGLTGFLHASDLPVKDGEDANAPVTERLHPGDEVIVQITRDSIGRKGPALTGRISLPGRYLVLMPFSSRSGISRRIPHGKERERLAKLLDQVVVPEGMGVILRTASDTTDLPALQADLEHLQAEWTVIQRKAAEPGQPGLLRGESDIAERSVRDIMPSDVTRIVVDKDDVAGHIHRLLRIWYPSEAAAADEHAHATVRQAAAVAETPLGELQTLLDTPEAASVPPVPGEAPGAEGVTADGTGGEPGAEGSEAAPAPVETRAERMERLVRVARAMPEVELHTDTMPLFHAYNVETQLEDAFRRAIRLPSGGSIVFDQTEALVAIDVNSGRLTDREDPEATALATNLEAVVEVARQLRLRDLGGLVVIDFIDMRERSARRDVETALRDGLSQDRARIRLGRMGPFGLVQLSRQRIRQALTRITHEECDQCAGTGRRRHLSGVGLRVLREVQARVARSKGRGGLEVRAPKAAVDWIRQHRSGALRALERLASGPITLAVDERLAADGWAMKGIPPAGSGGGPDELDEDDDRAHA